MSTAISSPIDYRYLLKAAIRGQVFEHDVPASPAHNPELDRPLSTDERQEFINCAREVFSEEPETRPHVTKAWLELFERTANEE